jgi:hypothetical protein
MTHPLDFVLPAKRKPLFFAFLAGTLVLFAVFRALDVPLRTPAAPNGIVSFELAGTPFRAQAILDSWLDVGYLIGHGPGQIAPYFVSLAYLFAAFGLGLDYLFMPLYASALAMGILLAAGRHPGRFFALGAWLGWGAYAAALFDAIENFALVRMLLWNQVWSPYPQLAAFSATVKFGLLLVGLLYVLAGWFWPVKKT